MLMSWQNREKSEQKQWWQCSQGVASAVHCVLILKFAVFQQKVITKSRPAASFKSTTTNTAVETVAGWPLDKNNLPLHVSTRPPSLSVPILNQPSWVWTDAHLMSKQERDQSKKQWWQCSAHKLKTFPIGRWSYVVSPIHFFQKQMGWWN